MLGAQTAPCGELAKPNLVSCSKEHFLSEVEPWLTKHFSVFGLALMDFDDRADTGITWKPLVAL